MSNFEPMSVEAPIFIDGDKRTLSFVPAEGLFLDSDLAYAPSNMTGVCIVQLALQSPDVFLPQDVLPAKNRNRVSCQNTVEAINVGFRRLEVPFEAFKTFRREGAKRLEGFFYKSREDAEVDFTKLEELADVPSPIVRRDGVPSWTEAVIRKSMAEPTKADNNRIAQHIRSLQSGAPVEKYAILEWAEENGVNPNNLERILDLLQSAGELGVVSAKQISGQPLERVFIRR